MMASRSHEPFRFVHVVRGQQDSSIALLKLPDNIPQLPAALWIEPSRWFVQEENLGIGYQRGRYRQALLLTPRQFAHPAISFFLQRKLLQNGIHRGRMLVETGEQLQRFPDRQLFGKPGLL